MNINITTKTTHQIDIEPEEAFRILCETLEMKFVLDEDVNYRVFKDDTDGENHVYVYGHLYDDRGDLFVALRNVAVNMFPNLSFRSADYIYKEGNK